MNQGKKSTSNKKSTSRKTRPRKIYNRDHYHRCQMSMPPIVEIEKRIQQWLNPFEWKETKMFVKKGKLPQQKHSKLRSRKLDLMVVMAIVLSLIYRQINSLTEVIRILNLRGLMWVKALKVSKQALSKRLQTLPAEIIAEILSQTISSIQDSENKLNIIPQKYHSVVESFPVIWIADGSTLEAIKKNSKY